MAGGTAVLHQVLGEAVDPGRVHDRVGPQGLQKLLQGGQRHHWVKQPGGTEPSSGQLGVAQPGSGGPGCGLA